MRRVLAVALGMATAIVTLPAGAAPVAARLPCRIGVMGQPGTNVYTTLADAVASAAAGATIVVTGICTGPTVIDRNVRIVGEIPGGALSTGGAGPAGLSAPTLDGKEGDTTLTVLSGVTVRAQDLVIIGGAAERGGNVRVDGTLILTSVRVLGGIAQRGAGIYVGDGGSLRLLGFTRVTGGRAGDVGGGIAVESGTVVVGGRSIIRGARATNNGGGIHAFRSTVRVGGAARIARNRATGFDGSGGGISALQSDIRVTRRAQIAENQAVRGGGVHAAFDSTLVLGDRASIRDNLATAQGHIAPTTQGGGVRLDATSWLMVEDQVTITGNSAPARGQGGGIFHEGTFRIEILLYGDMVFTVRCASPRLDPFVFGNRREDCVAAPVP